MRFRTQGRSLVVEAPAKLNLFLEILGKRPDGYHELETLMVTVGLYDTLSLTDDESSDITLQCAWADAQPAAADVQSHRIPTGPENLIVRAAELLRERTGVRRGVRIRLWKRIPMAAGLAGGSSDAAATLAGLNRLWKLGLTTEELQDLAARLGSDISFFLAPTPAAICRGRGEQVEPLPLPLDLHVVIAQPPVGLSTAAVFRQCRPAARPRSVGPLVAALRAGRLAAAARNLHNALQFPAQELCREVNDLQQHFAAEAVLGHLMSGSGTACFGLCAHRRQAARVASRLRAARIGRVFAASSRP